MLGYTKEYSLKLNKQNTMKLLITNKQCRMYDIAKRLSKINSSLDIISEEKIMAILCEDTTAKFNLINRENSLEKEKKELLTQIANL